MRGGAMDDQSESDGRVMHEETGLAAPEPVGGRADGPDAVDRARAAIT